MKTIDRRKAIKAGLIGAASLPLLTVGNAAAQSGRVWHSGHRVVSRENEQNVFGLSSWSIADERLEDLPEPLNATRIERTGERDYVMHVARLLEASYNNSPDSLEGINGNDFHGYVDGILETEPEARQILVHPQSKFYWANVNPVILVIIVPARVVATGFGIGAIAWALRPFVDGFLDEAGRDVWHWMTGLFRESGQ